MRRRPLRSGSLVAAMVLACLGGYVVPGGGQVADGNTVDATAVKAAVREFHDALADGDSARALELLHPNVRIFEGGHAETLAEYRSGHLAADMEFSSAVERKIVHEQVFGGSRRTAYLSEYHMTGTFRGEDVEAHGTETMVLLRTADGWRIRHIHWSSR